MLLFYVEVLLVDLSSYTTVYDIRPNGEQKPIDA